MDLYLHLKICESCGCLWLRSHSEPSVYCAPCLDRLSQFPAVGGRKGRGRHRKSTLPTVHAVDARELPVNFEFTLPAGAASTLPMGGLQ